MMSKGYESKKGKTGFDMSGTYPTKKKPSFFKILYPNGPTTFEPLSGKDRVKLSASQYFFFYDPKCPQNKKI
ncbi:MAG: hypothetical protein CM15mV144_300 [Caudoviricetes sp.]|nr:MAG: hypothetical protein CM15mV144_300 [Caudoviricetes sp.]